MTQRMINRQQDLTTARDDENIDLIYYVILAHILLLTIITFAFIFILVYLFGICFIVSQLCYLSDKS